MVRKTLSQKRRISGNRAQAMVEFAIALPVLLALLIGIMEVGRMMFMYVLVVNSSRDAVRYASAYGASDTNGYLKYKYCYGIKDVAAKSAYIVPLTSVSITYDSGPGTTSLGTCDLFASPWEDPDISVGTCDRVTVEVKADYKPMVKLLPISNKTITSKSSRSLTGIIALSSSGTTSACN